MRPLTSDHSPDIEEEDDMTKAKELMKPVAEGLIKAEKEKGKEPPCKFFVAGDVSNGQFQTRKKNDSVTLILPLGLPQLICSSRM